MAFTVYKTAKGYRWVAVSSTAYRDRDNEIVSRKALADAVDRANRTGKRGPLRFWHEPGYDLGTTDYQTLSDDGKYLIESGILNDDVADVLGTRLKNARYQMSIGFRHPLDEPDKDGVFHHIDIFERSIVPYGKAANPQTSLSVAKE